MLKDSLGNFSILAYPFDIFNKCWNPLNWLVGRMDGVRMMLKKDLLLFIDFKQNRYHFRRLSSSRPAGVGKSAFLSHMVAFTLGASLGVTPSRLSRSWAKGS